MKPRLTVAVLAVALAACNSEAKKRKYATEADRLYSQGKYRNAAELYGKAVSLDPQFATAYHGQGQSFLALGRWEDAERALRRSSDLLPENSAERKASDTQLAYALVHAWNDEKLRDVERIAIALCKADPNSFDGRRLLGDLALVRARKWAQANPGRVDYYVQDAILEYSVAAKVRPADTSLLLQTARALAVKGSLDESERAYRTVLRLDKTDAVAYADLYRLLLTEGKLEEAAKDLQSATENVTAYPGFAVMAAAQAAMTDTNSAAPDIEALKARSLGLPAANLIAGDFYVRIGQLERAKHEYGSCLSNSKYEAACRTRLIRLALYQDSDKGVAELVQDALKRDRGNTAALTAAGVLKAHEGDTEAAGRMLSSLLDVDVDGPFARYTLAKIQVQAGQFPEARLNLEVASRRRPDLVRVVVLLAEVQLALRQFSEARRSAEAVLAIESGNTRARSILNAAVVSAKDGDKLSHAYPPSEHRSPTIEVAMLSPDTAIAREVPLKDSVCDAAILSFKKLRSKDYTRTDLASAVPGIWAQSELVPYLGSE